MSTNESRTLGLDDVLPDDVIPRVSRNGDCALVPIDELDLPGLKGRKDCSHIYRVGDTRLYALEPNPEIGYWKCCPGCGLQKGQINSGEVPSELRVI